MWRCGGKVIRLVTPLEKHVVIYLQTLFAITIWLESPLSVKQMAAYCFKLLRAAVDICFIQMKPFLLESRLLPSDLATLFCPLPLVIHDELTLSLIHGRRHTRER